MTAVVPYTSPTVNALDLPAGLSQNEWEAVGEALGRITRASCWWIGDWINYGEDAGYVSDEKYDRAEELTGLARRTLHTYAYVCRKYSSSSRDEHRSFRDHRYALMAPGPAPDRFEVRTERDRIWADKAARRVYDGLSTMQGYCSALEEVRPERAIAGAQNGDIAAWDDMATKAIASLTRFRRAIRKGAINGNDH